MSYSQHDLALAFFCTYRELSEGDVEIPLSDHSLDRALKKAAEQMPENPIAKELHFADARTGTLCIELATLERDAYSGGILSYVSPSFTHARFEITQDCAKHARQSTEPERLFVSRVINNLQN